MVYILTGPTGCGKTFSAFYRNKKKKILYCGPCRQLIYEVAMKYGDINSNLITGDFSMGPKNANKSFRTYECVNENDLKQYDVIIIDEAHYMTDPERGSHIYGIMAKANKLGKKILLLSATMSLRIPGAKILRLPPRENFEKHQISYDEACERTKQGVPTLCFNKKREYCGNLAYMLNIPQEKVGIINADTPLIERISIINKYNMGEITLIEATNSVAQGVNLPCENLIMDENPWDGPEIIIQKLGRLGRTGVTAKGALLTYASLYDCDLKVKAKFCKEKIKEIRKTEKPMWETTKQKQNEEKPTKKEVKIFKKMVEEAWRDKR